MAQPERDDEDPFSHTRMTLGEHLEELRSRLVKSALALGIAFVIAWAFQGRVSSIAIQPYRWAMDRLEVHYVAEANAILAADPGRPRTEFFFTADPEDQRLRGFDKRLSAIKGTETFLFLLRICFYAALVVGAPVLLWQMWQFIAAGLYQKEKRAVTRYFPFSLLAFAVGVLFGYFWIVPYGMYYLNKSVSIELAVPSITVGYFLTFLSGLCLVFGLVFQLPLVLTFLAGAGIVDPAKLGKYRGHFAVAAFIVAAMLTPPDPFTQAMMAIPLIVLYEVGIWSAKVAARRHAAAPPPA